MNIANTFYHAALNHPNKIAIWQGKKSISYLKLQERVSTISDFLQKKGINKGDRVLVAIPIGIEFYASILAIMNIGAVVVLTDKILVKKEVQYAYHSSECKLMLTVPFLKLLQQFLFNEMKCITLPKQTQKDLFQPKEVHRKDTALITFTSGTTGKAKLANRTHHFLATQLDTLVDEMNITTDTVHLSNLPVVLLTTIASGSTTIIAKKRQKLYTQPINLISCSPFYAPQFLEKCKTPNVVDVFIGGSTILPSLAKFLQLNYPNTTIQFVYGSTEAEPISLIHINDYLKDVDRCFGVPVGQIHQNIELKIEPIHQQNGLTIGTICVKGNHVLNNYINQTKKEWMNTGDVGYLKDGKLYFLGRKKYCWVENNQFYSPLLVEKQSSSILPNQTVLNLNGKTILFTTHRKQVNVDFHQRINLKRFQFDKRHNSRINYEWLKKHT